MLNLCNNQFTGEISDSIGNLESLQSLSLCDNQLSGVIPESICDVTGGIVSGNKLCPPYPECIEDYLIGEQDTANCE